METSTQYDATVRDILRRDNPTEPGGEWSVYDIARQLDPQAHKPRSLFDTGGTPPREQFYDIAEAAVGRIKPSSRYVGGTSGHLYHLPRS